MKYFKLQYGEKWLVVRVYKNSKGIRLIHFLFRIKETEYYNLNLATLEVNRSARYHYLEGFINGRFMDSEDFITKYSLNPKTFKEIGDLVNEWENAS